MITEANLNRILRIYKKDIAEDTSLFINEALLLIQSTFPIVTSGYIALVDHDIWFVHSYFGNKFSLLIETYKEQLLQKSQFYLSGIPLANDIEKVFPIENKNVDPYVSDTMATFYEHFEPIIKDALIECHKPSAYHVIIPFFLENRLLGHMVLGLNNETLLNQIKQMLHDMENFIDILTICLYSMGKERLTEDTNYMINNVLAIANTTLLTGYVHKSFMTNLLNTAMHLIPEADYGSSIIISNDFWIFNHAIGHDSEELKKIPITKAIFQENMAKSSMSFEVEKDVFIIDHILSFSNNPSEKVNDILNRLTKASKPIKLSMQVHIKSRGQLQGILSLDIRPDSPLQFSKKSAKVLKQVGQIASMFFNYNTLYDYTESFSQLTELISNFMGASNDTSNQFIRAFLELLINSIPEANYGTIFIRSKGKIQYIDAIGHNIDALRKLDIDERYLKDHDLDSDFRNSITPISIYQDVHNLTAAKMPEILRNAYLKAVKPVQESIVCHYPIDSNTIVDLSIDISKNSFMNFSSESIRIFKAFSNIGFAFITHQLFSSENTGLTETPEEKRVEI